MQSVGFRVEGANGMMQKAEFMVQNAGQIGLGWGGCLLFTCCVCGASAAAVVALLCCQEAASSDVAVVEPAEHFETSIGEHPAKVLGGNESA